MKVVLAPGEKIDIEFADTDGKFTIEYGYVAVSVIADLPDASGRVGEIYREPWARSIPEDEVVSEETDTLICLGCGEYIEVCRCYN